MSDRLSHKSDRQQGVSPWQELSATAVSGLLCIPEITLGVIIGAHLIFVGLSLFISYFRISTCKAGPVSSVYKIILNYLIEK